MGSCTSVEAVDVTTPGPTDGPVTQNGDKAIKPITSDLKPLDGGSKPTLTLDDSHHDNPPLTPLDSEHFDMSNIKVSRKSLKKGELESLAFGCVLLLCTLQLTRYV